ncbi:uncharacterized, partial [Tachysurus ichikawai]
LPLLHSQYLFMKLTSMYNVKAYLQTFERVGFSDKWNKEIWVCILDSFHSV